MANINKIKREADNLLNSGYASMDARQILWERYASSFESRRDFDNVIGTYIRRKRRRAENASASTEKSNKIIPFSDKTATTCEVTSDKKGNTEGIIKAPVGTFTTEEDMLRYMELDPAEFAITACRKSKWEAQTPDGIVPMEAMRVTVEKRIPQLTEEDVAEMVQKSVDRAASMVTFPKVPKSKTTEYGRMGVFQLCDCHFGAYCSRREHGIDWGPKECAEDVAFITDQAIAQLKATPVDGLLIAMTGDALNSDTITHTTAHGTQQFDGLLHYKDLICEYFEMMTKVVDRFAKELGVQINIIHTVGNHDEKTMYDMMLALRVRYKNDPNVHVLDELNQRKYRIYGNSLLMFTHGQSESKRIKLCPQNEAPEAWGVTKFTYIFAEHTHQYRLEPDGRTLVLTGSTIAPPGTWTKNSAYVGARRGAQLCIIDKQYGLVNQCFLPVLHDNDEIDDFVVDVEQLFA